LFAYCLQKSSEEESDHDFCQRRAHHQEEAEGTETNGNLDDDPWHLSPSTCCFSAPQLPPPTLTTPRPTFVVLAFGPGALPVTAGPPQVPAETGKGLHEVAQLAPSLPPPLLFALKRMKSQYQESTSGTPCTPCSPPPSLATPCPAPSPAHTLKPKQPSQPSQPKATPSAQEVRASPRPAPSKQHIYIHMYVYIYTRRGAQGQ